MESDFCRTMVVSTFFENQSWGAQYSWSDLVDRYFKPHGTDSSVGTTDRYYHTYFVDYVFLDDFQMSLNYCFDRESKYWTKGKMKLWVGTLPETHDDVVQFFDGATVEGNNVFKFYSTMKEATAAFFGMKDFCNRLPYVRENE
jgi:hypothetical protein